MPQYYKETTDYQNYSTAQNEYSETLSDNQCLAISWIRFWDSSVGTATMLWAGQLRNQAWELPTLIQVPAIHRVSDFIC
jgi:hypothetical protein